MDKRNAMRAGAVTAAATLMMLMSSPAMALVRDDGDDPGSGLSVGASLGLFVGLPILAFAVIAGLCMLPGSKKK
ncbi:photosystem II reaction center protein PsbW [Kitasatospora sp. NPDC088391]|uniref:photosystem II reaction center protein PsbW n=1 Tax=Kitasatospora sp. NPDC088391 TaxID=3364074 RepID=UPI00382542D9